MLNIFKSTRNKYINKKNKKIYKKTLDKYKIICYNIYRVKRRIKTNKNYFNNLYYFCV